MGFRDYYRQFDDLDELELNLRRRERRERERRLALDRVPDLDLSGTEWPEMPHSEIVNAAIARARGRVNGYPDRHAAGVRRLLAERHEVDPERIVLGNGAAELLQAAALALLSEGDELLMPWPSYPLYPLLAARAGAQPVPVEGGPLLEAVSERTRAVVLCNPNDPTGDFLPAERLGALLAALPPHVHVLVDEALVHFQDVEDLDAGLALTEAFPRLLVVRTFSKAYGLSGLRTGYAVGSDPRLLNAIAPVLGVNALSQAAVEYALRAGDREIDRRREPGGRRADPAAGRPQGPRRGVGRQPGQLRVAHGRRPERRGAGRPAAAPGRDRGARRPTRRRRPRASGRPRRARPPTACCARSTTRWRRASPPTGAAARRWSARGCAARPPSARAPRRSSARPCAPGWRRSRCRGGRTRP